VLVLYAFDGLLERLGVPGSRGARAGRLSRPALPIARRLSAVVALLALLAALSIAITPWRIASPELPLPVDAIDRRLGPWHSVDLETDRLFLGMAALTGSVHRRYSRAGDWVNVFVAAGSPRLRFRSFYTAKTSLPGSGWIIEEQTRSELDRRALDVLIVRRGAERRLVHHWHVGTRGFGEELLRETLALDASPLARAHRGVVVRLETPLESLRPRGDAEARLEEIRGYLLDSLEKTISDPGGMRRGRYGIDVPLFSSVGKVFLSMYTTERP
jgi:hypothetical protein